LSLKTPNRYPLPVNCPILKNWSIILVFTMLAATANSQGNPADTAVTPVAAQDLSVIDTTLDYDELFQDFDAFMDSILSPHSYFLTSLSMTKGYYNFERKNRTTIETLKKLTYSPTFGYYHKGGLGITGTGYIVDDDVNMNFYQGSVTGSFDHLANKKIATGLSYTKFFTRDSLPFYTTPLQNELFAYFTYRKWWIKPMVAISYGWGSRTDYAERESLIQDLQLRRRGFTYVNTEEKISDLSVMTSVRHDFYWLDVITYKDHIRFTPQVTFTSGTQKFGFNQSSSTYGTLINTRTNVLYSTENVYLDDEIKFQPLSLTLFLRGEYAIGKFFVQPQLAMDYYFPATSGNFNTIFSLNIGCMF
jgi:hypothetical protein